MPVKIIIADDDALIRESLNIIFNLDERFEIIKVCENGKEAVDVCRDKQVDVAILDIRMPELNGVEATKAIVELTDTRVMILTTFDEDAYVKDAFSYGASGYLLKNSPPDQIKNAVLTVYGGSSVVQDVVMEQLNSPNVERLKKLDILTTREKEVVALIAEGLTNFEIAGKLFITEGTVKNTVSNILGKLELKHRTQIAIFYLTD
jgi:DNA-binding NarL/FixJ family response regulator